MDDFKCKRCGHGASSLWNLKSHLSRSKPCHDLNSCGKTQEELLEEISANKSDWEHECDACGAKYKSRQGLYLHKKNKKCNAEDIRKYQEAKANTHVSVSNSTGAIVNTGAIINSPGAIINSPGAIVNNTIVNITINNFGQERTDYVINDKEFMENSLTHISTYGLVNIINKIFNDKGHPENKTVLSQNKKKNTFKIRKEDKWEDAHGQQVIPSMIRKGFDVAYTHFNSNIEKMEKERKEAFDNKTTYYKEAFFNDLTIPNSTAFKNEYAKTRTLAHNY
jgi:hypothetical protein